jgi:hypothetical protein
LGSGSYGKVHLVQNRQDKSEAAAKVAEIESSDGLYEFVSEIKILVSGELAATASHRRIYAPLHTYFASSFWHTTLAWQL